MSANSDPEPPLVVGVAVIRAGRLLLARRVSPPRLAGMWELPGGKVEPGETIAAAAARELDEELSIGISVVDALDDAYPLEGGYELVVVRAELLPGTEPIAGVAHDAVRWLSDADVADFLASPSDSAVVNADLAPIAALQAAGWLDEV